MRQIITTGRYEMPTIDPGGHHFQMTQLAQGNKPTQQFKMIVRSSDKTAEGLIEGRNYKIVGSLIPFKVSHEDGTTDHNLQIAGARFQEIPEALQFCHVSAVGNLGQDPDTRHFESGSVKSSASMAIRVTRDQSLWLNIECWAKAAEILSQYAVKGSKIGITGELCRETWIDRGSGRERFKFFVNVPTAYDLELLSNKNNDENTNNNQAQYHQKESSTQTRRQSVAKNPEPVEEPDFDDIPF
jgi:single-strand DNA-binding protein